jgi:zinc protease
MRDGISEDELDRVKASRRGGFVRGIERIGGFGGKSDVLARNAVYTGRPDFYKVQLQRFEEASTASIEAAIDRWLRHGAYHLEVRPFPDLSAASEGADRSAVPETVSFPEVAFNEFQRDSLSNGLELIVAPRTSIPVINMSLAFGYAGRRHETTHGT